MVNEWKQIAYKKLDADADTITLGDTTAKTADALFGTSADQVIETFATYTDQTDANTSWTPNNDVAGYRVNVTTDLLEFNCDSDGDNDDIAYDLGANAVSDTAWTLRFKATLKTKTSNPDFWVGLSSHDETTGSGTAQDTISVRFQGTSLNSFYARWSENEAPDINTNDVSTTTTWVADEVKYIELKRMGTVVRANAFSDSNYSVLLDTVNVTGCTASGLRYLKASARVVTNATDATVEYDDFQFWNGTNTVVEGGFESHDMMKLVTWIEPTGGTMATELILNEDHGGSMSRRYSNTGGTDTTSVEDTGVILHNLEDTPIITETMILDFPNQEKLMIHHAVESDVLGSGTAPNRGEQTIKDENQIDRITTLKLTRNTGVGQLKKGSYAILYGANRPTITHANGNTLVEVQGDAI